MKKGRWLLPVCIVIGVLAMCVVAAFWLFNIRGYSLTIGRCLVADNGCVMLVDGNSPIVMSNQTKKEGFFAGLATGDEILVLHDGINDSYPGDTGAYFCMRLDRGDMSDIPEVVLRELQDLGWLGGQEEDAALPQKTQTDPNLCEEAFIQNSYRYANMTLLALENWEYEATEYSEEMGGFGITFRPKDQSVGSLTLFYYDAWGVCGTGLEEKLAFLGDYEVWIGTYDNHELWDFISVKNMPGNYVFLNTGVESWWEEYEDEAMQIIESAVLAKGIMTQAQAINLAMAAVTGQGEHEAGWCSFDNDTGIWEIQLHAVNNTGPDYTVHVFPDETSEIAEAVICD